MTGVRAIDLDALKATGVDSLLLDLDNTVSPHHSTTVVPEIRDWLATLPGRGFSVCFVSNNWHDDVHERAAALGFPVVPKAGKPLPFGIRKAMRLLGSEPGACAMIGDQLFTDILGGNCAGAVTVLVEPLTHVDLPHTRVLRRLEQRIMAGRNPEA